MWACPSAALRGRAARAVGNETTVANGAEPPAQPATIRLWPPAPGSRPSGRASLTRRRNGNGERRLRTTTAAAARAPPSPALPRKLRGGGRIRPPPPIVILSEALRDPVPATVPCADRGIFSARSGALSAPTSPRPRARGRGLPPKTGALPAHRSIFRPARQPFSPSPHSACAGRGREGLPQPPVTRPSSSQNPGKLTSTHSGWSTSIAFSGRAPSTPNAIAMRWS